MSAKLLLLGVCVHTLLASFAIAAPRVAPGDEDQTCLQPTFQIHPPVFPSYYKVHMDSRHYLNLLDGTFPAWTRINRGGSGKCTHGLGGICGRKIRCCTYQTKPEENYVILQHINITGAKEVFVNLTYDFACPSSASSCDQAIDILLFETDVANKQQSKTTSNYKLLEEVEGVRNREITITASFIPQNTGFYLAIRENGTCVNLNPTTVYSEQCPSKTENLVYYPTMYSPPRGSTQPALGKGKCLDHSSQDEGKVTEPTIECHHGNQFRDTQCYCDPGYSYDHLGKVCEACPSGTYKNTYSNIDRCKPCPSNSLSGVAAGTCDCLSGYFRASTEGPHDPCTAPPSAPRDLQVSGISNISISLEWNLPLDDGGRSDVCYVVGYQRYDSLHLGYNHVTTNLKDPRIIINGLSPLTKYEVKVVAENGVSSQTPSDGERTALVTSTTTDGVPGKIIIFAKRHGNTLTWQTPQVTNGNITGFNLRIYLEDHEDEATVIALEALDFCYSPIPSEVPPGTGEVFVQVCAKTQIGCGEWSDAVHYKTITPADQIEEAEVPDAPSNVQSLCTVVVWGEPANPNGVIQGYDLRFRRIGTSRISDIQKSDTELYHVVEDSDLPSGDEDLEFRVRAKNSLAGTWSDWTPLGPRCPDSTCPPAQECPSSTPCPEILCPAPDPVTCPTPPPCPTTPPPVVTTPGVINVIEVHDCRVATWELPSDNGGGEITNYRARIYYKVNGVRTFDTTTIYDPIETQWLAPPTLPEERPLFFQVRAMNPAGFGLWSAEVEFSDSSDCRCPDCPTPPPCPTLPECPTSPPITIPAKITDVQVLDCIVAVWAPPEGQITGYSTRVYNKNGGGTMINVATSDIGDNETQWLAPDVPDQTPLFFQVKARNSAGLATSWSDEVELFSDSPSCPSINCPTVECPTAPSCPTPTPPTVTVTTPGAIDTVHVFNCEGAAWEPPSDNGGGEITEYRIRVYYKVNGLRTFDMTTFYDPIKTQWLVPTDLPEQRPLYIQVKARNSAGQAQPWSPEVVFCEDDEPTEEPTSCPTPSPCPPSNCPMPAAPETTESNLQTTESTPETTEATPETTESTSSCPNYEDCTYEFCSRNKGLACIKSREGCCEVSHCRACYQAVGDPDSSACDAEQCASINCESDQNQCLKNWGLCVRRSFPGLVAIGDSASAPFDCIAHPCVTCQ